MNAMIGTGPITSCFNRCFRSFMNNPDSPEQWAKGEKRVLAFGGTGQNCPDGGRRDLKSEHCQASWGVEAHGVALVATVSSSMQVTRPFVVTATKKKE